jgi:hypothetical protein
MRLLPVLALLLCWAHVAAADMLNVSPPFFSPVRTVTAAASGGNCSTCAMSGQVSIQIAGAASGSGNLTVTGSSGIVVASCVVVNGASTTLTGVTASGLTFTQFAGATETASQVGLGGTLFNSIQAYWAPYSAPFSAKAITFTTSASADDTSCTAFGISGASTTAPLDSSGVTATAGTYTTNVESSGTVSVTTTMPNDFLVLLIGNGDTPTSTAGNVGGAPGTLIDNNVNGGGCCASTLNSAYRTPSAAVTAQPGFFNGTTSSSAPPYGFVGLSFGVQ